MMTHSDESSNVFSTIALDWFSLTEIQVEKQIQSLADSNDKANEKEILFWLTFRNVW